MTFKDTLVKIKNKILDTIYPNDIKCILCGKDLPSSDTYFCDKCLNEHIFNNENRCKICDTKIKEGNIICDNCKNNKRYFSKCFCPLNYENKVRQALIKFKSDNARYLAKPFAKLIYNRLKEEQINFDIIVPVPSHPKTIKKRGYNPALLLAKELSILFNKPIEELLIKNVLTKNQKLLSYKDRQNNLTNSIILTDKKASKNKTILLVDDIITTGATLNVCAQLFTNAKEVFACAVARNQI